jgi:hypothetical protein
MAGLLRTSPHSPEANVCQEGLLLRPLDEAAVAHLVVLHHVADGGGDGVRVHGVGSRSDLLHVCLDHCRLRVGRLNAALAARSRRGEDRADRSRLVVENLDLQGVPVKKM